VLSIISIKENHLHTIDVLGIEGKEEEYETIIMDAVTKLIVSLCLFYK
jgi:hypothetical protein